MTKQTRSAPLILGKSTDIISKELPDLTTATALKVWKNANSEGITLQHV